MLICDLGRGVKGGSGEVGAVTGRICLINPRRGFLCARVSFRYCPRQNCGESAGFVRFEKLKMNLPIENLNS
jgi:hypothetical protein